jgi:hypothetical protein
MDDGIEAIHHAERIVYQASWRLQEEIALQGLAGSHCAGSGTFQRGGGRLCRRGFSGKLRARRSCRPAEDPAGCSRSPRRAVRQMANGSC